MSTEDYTFLTHLVQLSIKATERASRQSSRAPFVQGPVSTPGSQAPGWEREQDVIHPFSHPFCQTEAFDLILCSLLISFLTAFHFQCLQLGF